MDARQSAGKTGDDKNPALQMIVPKSDRVVLDIQGRKVFVIRR